MEIAKRDAEIVALKNRLRKLEDKNKYLEKELQEEKMRNSSTSRISETRSFSNFNPSKNQGSFQTAKFSGNLTTRDSRKSKDLQGTINQGPISGFNVDTYSELGYKKNSPGQENEFKFISPKVTYD